MNPSTAPRDVRQAKQCSVHGNELVFRHGSPNCAEASYIVGLACYYGDGVIQDYSEAAKYFKLAAQAGHGQAALNAGHMFDNAKGITRDANAAFSYFALAANGGNGEACLRAGAMLYSEAASLPPNADPEHNIKTAIHVSDAGHASTFDSPMPQRYL